jgi:hypothetical protein
LVSNAETYAHIALICRHGPRWFRELGTAREPGSALVTLSGPVASPGVYEIELGLELRELVSAAGGVTHEPQAALVGGYGGAWIGAEHLGALRLSEAGLEAYGTSLGAGVVLLLDRDACPVSETLRTLQWLAAQSAGQCGPCVYGLQAIAGELGVSERVSFRGSVAQAELRVYYSAAEALLMPSYSESFGLVGLEAQACGCPVVGSGVSGIRSVVRDEVTGFLVEGDDPSAYAERIGRLLADPESARQMGLRGRLLAQRFSWSRTADRLAEMFTSLVASHDRVQAGIRHE